jgi:hypothetical protein
MTDAVEVAVEAALLESAQLFANSQSITIAMPNIAFVPPTVSLTAKYLAAAFLPAPTAPLAVSFSGTNQHYGIFQLSVFYGQGSGEMGPARIVAQIIDWFRPGTVLDRDGFQVRILKTPYRGPLLKADPWTFIPVSIPYTSFAPNPA